MKKISVVTHSQEPPENPIIYIDLVSEAGCYGIGVQAWLESRVFEDYQEIDTLPQEDTLAVMIFSILDFHVKDKLWDKRMTLLLVRRDSGKIVEVDLVVRRRRNHGKDRYLIQFVGEREFCPDGP
jgi:hypothetical protein